MHTPACQSIIAECKSLGFIVGQAKEDNGLWKDCFGPVVKGGGTPTRDGKPDQRAGESERRPGVQGGGVRKWAGGCAPGALDEHSPGLPNGLSLHGVLQVGEPLFHRGDCRL